MQSQRHSNREQTHEGYACVEGTIHGAPSQMEHHCARSSAPPIPSPPANPDEMAGRRAESRSEL
eukprot:364568-Chlamydomonas_euryale.AAC.18